MRDCGYESGSSRNNRLRLKNRKKLRTSSERFHDLYESTGCLLGEGAQGSVQCYVHKPSNKQVAVKIIEKSVNYDRSKVLKEIGLLHLCRGQPYIMEMIEYYEESDKFYLVFEKLDGGSLSDNIFSRDQLREQEARSITKQLATALKFLHQNGIAHRDVKPENILCSNQDSLLPVKLCDFDLATAVVTNEGDESSVLTPEYQDAVGSLEYMAPEVVDVWVGGWKPYNKKCDMWSLGVTIYMMLSGTPPFIASCGRDCGWDEGYACQDCQDLLFDSIQEGSFRFYAQIWSGISDDAKDLISKLLVKNPEERLSPTQVLNHPWITNASSNQNTETSSVHPRVTSAELFMDAINAFDQMESTEGHSRQDSGCYTEFMDLRSTSSATSSVGSMVHSDSDSVFDEPSCVKL